ncbi:MAG: phosphatase PAP2 family protein [Clostridiales bacterium]|nr:phosphatase PAP2 family protein [Clostridiales bacterium]
MKKEKLKRLWLALGFLVAFILWTVLVKFVDVKPIGPKGSKVGLAAINGFFSGVIGKNLTLYVITDWLGLLPIATVLCFAVLGLNQWIKRKSLFKVDRDLITLGVFYIVVIAVYILFEVIVINYRPILINGYLESSYPSSTTMLVTCVMPTALMQVNSRVKNKHLKKFILYFIITFIAFMVIGRLVSGVHWLSDIIGGALFSIGIVTLYHCFVFKGV